MNRERHSSPRNNEKEPRRHRAASQSNPQNEEEYQDRKTHRVRRTHHTPQRRRRRPRGKKGLLLGLLALLFIGVAIAAGLALTNVLNFSHDIYKDSGAERMRDADKQLSQKKPITILVEGLDSGAMFYKNVSTSRSDVIMLVAINPETKKSTIVNIPRDVLAPMGTSNDFDKINHAYMEGGIKESINSLQRFLDIPIDYYVSVNMEAFIDIIDGMGGVELTPAMTFEQDGSKFVEGQTETFNGEDAMNYVRMRKQDPEGDVGRGRRQQQLMQAVINKVMTLGTITNYDEILDKLKNNLYTNLSVSDMYQLQSQYLSSIKSPEHVIVDNYENLNLSFGYYMHLPETERLRVSNALRSQLGLEASNSAILYPASYGVVNDAYVTTLDNNGDGVITDDDMLVPAGVYTVDELQKEFTKYGATLDLSWRDSSSSSDASSSSQSANPGAATDSSAQTN
ncbi:MAG: LCP family protein [Aerococcus sp.]|nr:LCP family protein [Aerococcus sp.]